MKTLVNKMKKITKVILLMLIPAHALLLTKRVIPTNSATSIRESFSPVGMLIRDNVEITLILAGVLSAGFIYVVFKCIKAIRKYLILRRAEKLERVLKQARSKVNKLEADIFSKYFYMKSEIIQEFAPVRLLLNTLEAKLEKLNHMINEEGELNLDYLLYEEFNVPQNAHNSIIYSSTYNNVPEIIELDECENLISRAFEGINLKLNKLKIQDTSVFQVNTGKGWVHARNL